MPGLVKILVLAVLALGVWYGYRQFKRWQARSAERLDRASSTPQGGRRAVEAEEMVRCRICSTYVAHKRARACGRADCPYPAG